MTESDPKYFEVTADGALVPTPAACQMAGDRFHKPESMGSLMAEAALAAAEAESVPGVDPASVARAAIGELADEAEPPFDDFGRYLFMMGADIVLSSVLEDEGGSEQ